MQALDRPNICQGQVVRVRRAGRAAIAILKGDV